MYIYRRGLARRLYHGSRTMDVGQSCQVQCGPDGTALSRIKVRSCFLRLARSRRCHSEFFLLGIMISSDLSLQKHVATVCLFSVLLLAPSAEKSPTLSACRADENSCSCWLLQLSGCGIHGSLSIASRCRWPRVARAKSHRRHELNLERTYIYYL